jgi:hypothetical protein
MLIVHSGHPFDLTKTRLQTAAPGAYKGALDVVKKTVARDGISGYRHLSLIHCLASYILLGQIISWHGTPTLRCHPHFRCVILGVKHTILPVGIAPDCFANRAMIRLKSSYSSSLQTAQSRSFPLVS